MLTIEQELERLPLTKAFLDQYAFSFTARMFDADNRFRPSLRVFVYDKRDADPTEHQRPLLLMHFVNIEDQTDMRMEFYDATGNVLFSLTEDSTTLLDRDAFPALNVGWGVEPDSILAMRAYLLVNQTNHLMLMAGDQSALTGLDAQEILEHLITGLANNAIYLPQPPAVSGEPEGGST